MMMCISQVGYYGAPEFGQNQVPCRECLCPGTRASGHSYAETCYLDDQTMQPICHCDDGYAGDRYREVNIIKLQARSNPMQSKLKQWTWS